MVRVICDRSRSVFLIHARWHEEDAVGKHKDDPEWIYANLPAVAEQGLEDALGRKPGQVLWPEHPEKGKRDYFAPFEKDAWDWASLYQGRPRARGGRVFERDVEWYDGTLPVGEAVRYSIGYDLAYTENKRSDFSVIVVMARVKEVFYVVDVWRGQVEPDEFRRQLVRMKASYPGISPFGWTSGTERGAVKLLNSPGYVEKGQQVVPGANLSTADARQAGDKFVRALPFATAWNNGLVRIPSQPHPHIGEFVKVLKNFTGAGGGERDDDVDAGAAAHHKLKTAGGSLVKPPPIRVWRR